MAWSQQVKFNISERAPWKVQIGEAAQACGAEKQSWRGDSNSGPADYECLEGHYARQPRAKDADETEA